MQLAKWGNSLAVRIPAEVVERLGLAPGEEVQFEVTGEGSFEVSRDRRRLKAIEKMRSMRFSLPEDYSLNRDELHER
jgi:antitoxin MazE